MSLEDLDLTHLLRDIQEVLRQNDLVLPEDVAQLLKVFVTLDGLGRSLDPDFVMAEHVAPYLREALVEALHGLLELGLALLHVVPALLSSLVRHYESVKEKVIRFGNKEQFDRLSFHRYSRRSSPDTASTPSARLTAAKTSKSPNS